MTAPNVNIFFSRLIIKRLTAEGVELFIISPGSRSAPLAIAASEQKNTRTKVIVDERTAAYYAVGYARAFGRAAALICTSGTAAANYYPAIIEAFQSRLPLFVLTADRPEELQNCGANQTINQENLYGHYAKSMTISAFDSKSRPGKILTRFESTLKDAIEDSNTVSIPIHINCRFREPLAPSPQVYDYRRLFRLVDEYYKDFSLHKTTTPKIKKDEINQIAAIIKQSKKGIIIAGPEARHRKTKSVGKLSKALNWPILTDILSQYRFASQETPGHPIGLYDLYLDNDAAAAPLKPDCVIQVGGLPTSKKLNQFLSDLKGIPIIKIQNHKRTIDPDGIHTETVIANEELFIKHLSSSCGEIKENDYLSKWLAIEYQCQKIIDDYLGRSALNEISIYSILKDTIPAKQALYLSNSMPVRDADSFIPVVRKGVITGANRGASGIDGIVASACGYAEGSQRTTTLIIGDMACRHDLTSLRYAVESAKPVIIIIINNDGGGIFHFLPIAKYEQVFDRYFAAPEDISFKDAAGLYGLNYTAPKSLLEFKTAYETLQKNKQSGMIEIVSDRKENLRNHQEIQNLISEKLSKA